MKRLPGAWVKPAAWLTTSVFLLLLAIAASSGPVSLWSNPQPTFEPGGGSNEPAVVAPVAPTIGQQGGGSGSVLLNVVGALATAGLIGILVFAGRGLGPSIWIGRPGFGRRRRSRIDTPLLPEVARQQPGLDVDEAVAVLRSGIARNAIVECWMYLEEHAATLGLPRTDAETSSEYVERVVASSSVDPAPISGFAAMYREARFSDHEIGDAHRERAIITLRRVSSALSSSADGPK